MAGLRQPLTAGPWAPAGRGTAAGVCHPGRLPAGLQRRCAQAGSYPSRAPPGARGPTAETQGRAAPAPWSDEAADVLRCVPGAITCLLLSPEGTDLGRNEPQRHGPPERGASEMEAQSGEGAFPGPHGGAPARISAFCLAAALLCVFFRNVPVFVIRFYSSKSPVKQAELRERVGSPTGDGDDDEERDVSEQSSLRAGSLLEAHAHYCV